MSRYIEADNAIERLGAYLMTDAQIEYGGLASEDIDDWKPIAIDILKGAPSIDIEPKRGEWVKRTHNTLIAQVNFAYCSECGQPIMHEHTRSLWSFCPNCGADMRERECE